MKENFNYTRFRTESIEIGVEDGKGFEACEGSFDNPLRHQNTLGQ